MVEYQCGLMEELKMQRYFLKKTLRLKQLIPEDIKPSFATLLLLCFHSLLLTANHNNYKLHDQFTQIKNNIENSDRMKANFQRENQIYNLFDMMKVAIFLVCLEVLCLSLPAQNPIIGIFTLPSEGDQPKAEDQVSQVGATNYTYIAACYVKYIQMSGAQVVPIFSFSNRSYFDDLLPKLNGVLFTGGGYDININNKWTQNADYILKWAINQNQNGKVFPVWGTCLGWELLAYLTSGYDSKVLSLVRGEKGVINTLSIKEDGYLYSGLTPTLKYNLQNGQGVTYFNHAFAVSTSYYQSNPKFKSFWNIVSTTKSSYNEEFISTAESKEYPVYGIQFHPQKNLYEWKVKADRSASGVEIAQILSNKFVDMARKSSNRFVSYDQFKKSVIYNYKTQFTNMSFIQIYLFPEIVTSGSQQANLVTQ